MESSFLADIEKLCAGFRVAALFAVAQLATFRGRAFLRSGPRSQQGIDVVWMIPATTTHDVAEAITERLVGFGLTWDCQLL